MNSSVSVDRRYQVFVSSTYVDLIEERRAVIQALLELDCIPAGMEMFPAANEDQWTLICEVIDLSDFYIVVVGGRYGSVTPEGISYTEKEYDYAVAQGIPVLGFVHGAPGSIPVDMVEINQEARDKLEAFRAKVMERHVKEYKSPDELASVVSRGLVRAIRRNARPGWVRGDQAMTDAVRTEIAELRAALAEAQKRTSDLAQGAARGGLDESFEHGDDVVTLNFNVSSWTSGTDQDVELDFTWDEIVDLIGPFMLDEARDPVLRKGLCDHAWRSLLEMPEGGWETVLTPTVTIHDDSWGRVLVQLRALGIIAIGEKRRTVSDRSVYWKLTPAGDDYLVRLKATKREPAPPAS